MEQFDVIIVGSGPGGYVTAIRARQLGFAKVALIERDRLGGVCLNWGCIPTKSLLWVADLYRHCRQAEHYGLQIRGLDFQIDSIVKRSREVATQLSGGVRQLLRKHRVVVFGGTAKLVGDQIVEISPTNNGKPTDQVSQVTRLQAPHIVLATGARSRILPGLKPDGQLIWTAQEAMTPDVTPGSLVVVGSGAIGIEFASFYRTLGSEVVVVEVQDRILPAEDQEISQRAQSSFERQGMRILTRAQVTSCRRQDNGQLLLEVDQQEPTNDPQNPTRHQLTADRVLVAVGIVGNVDGLGLENTQVQVERHHIVVDKWQQTHEPGVYAIGDVTRAPWLAHKASHEGLVCIERIAGLENVHPVDYQRVPACTYSYPQVASIGLTERQALDHGYDIRVGRFPYVGNGKALAMDETDGLIKTIFDANNGQLLGAHLIGAEVTELIHGYSIAQTLESTETELIQTIFPHPTLSEMMHESVLAAYGRAIHI